MSSATNMLAQLAFHDKFEENRTSQHTGYRRKNPGIGAKRYQFVLAQRKEGLYISIPKTVLTPHILDLHYEKHVFTEESDDSFSVSGGEFWVLPSKENLFLSAMESRYPSFLKGEVAGSFCLWNGEYEGADYQDTEFGRVTHKYTEKIPFTEDYSFDIPGEGDICLKLYEGKLFPYAGQVFISSVEVLGEFINYFAKVLMENE